MKNTIKKAQRKLLFGLISYVSKKEGLCMNPFYKQNEKAIKDNKEFAKEVYPKVFWSHLNFLYNNFGDLRGFPKDKRMEQLIV